MYILLQNSHPFQFTGLSKWEDNHTVEPGFKKSGFFGYNTMTDPKK